VVDEWDRRAELVLAGPRGRAVCLTISGLWPLNYRSPDWSQDEDDDDETIVFLSANDAHYDDQAVSALADALSAVPVQTLLSDDETVTDAVADSVSDAAYWQEPDADDLLLADPRVLDALRPIAKAIVGSAAPSWWTDPLDPDDQYFVSWLWKRKLIRADPPLLTGAAGRRDRWRADAIREERARQPASGHRDTRHRTAAAGGRRPCSLVWSPPPHAYVTVCPPNSSSWRIRWGCGGLGLPDCSHFWTHGSMRSPSRPIWSTLSPAIPCRWIVRAGTTGSGRHGAGVPG
jgi:hypothetical protein